MFPLNTITSYLTVTLLSILITFIGYSWFLKTWNYFTEKNVKFVRGLPLLGSHYKVFLGKLCMIESLQGIYNRFPQNKIVGLYELGGRPSYLIRDPDLIREITIKDSDHFVNRSFQLDKSSDPLLARSLFSMSNQPWREMRATLSPLFTGSKMRFMMSLIVECASDLNAFIKKEISSSGSNTSREFDMMDLLSRLETDIISSTAFGLKVNTLEDLNSRFYRFGSTMADAFFGLKPLFVMYYPKLASWLKIKIFVKEHEQFFRDVIRDTVNERHKNNIVRNDMLHLLLLAKEGKLNEQQDKEIDQDTGFATISEVIAHKTSEKLKNWTEEDLVAQSVNFFLSGFSGTTIMLSYLCYELSLHQDKQNKLYEEISTTHDDLNGKPITFECLQRMKYMDMVVSEILRLWALAVMDRRVNKEYLIEDYDRNKILLQPNDIVVVPVYGIHRDEKYWPNPNEFIPERFSNENKANIRPGTYMPFGSGPRACTASRYVLLQLKVFLYYMLLHFQIECSEKTPIPIKLMAGTGKLIPEMGFWNSFTVRVCTHS